MPEKTDKPVSRRQLQKNVDLSFVAIVIDAMFQHGLRANGTRFSLYAAVEIIRGGRDLGVFPSTDAVQLVVDELAGRPILPPRRKRGSDVRER